MKNALVYAVCIVASMSAVTAVAAAPNAAAGRQLQRVSPGSYVLIPPAPV